ncbi:MAG: hypothetical protein IPJ45_05685 [Ignavibacteria bacterium]|nr:hypothetical protein [Ignavibacteria bacterium]
MNAVSLLYLRADDNLNKRIAHKTCISTTAILKKIKSELNKLPNTRKNNLGSGLK